MANNFCIVLLAFAVGSIDFHKSLGSWFVCYIDNQLKIHYYLY